MADHSSATLRAWLETRPWPGGGSVQVLRIAAERDWIQVWPVSAKDMRKLAAELLRLADEAEVSKCLPEI